MRIDVSPASTAAVGGAAGDLAGILRRATDRLQATCPMAAATATLPAWRMTWATLRTILPGLAMAVEDLATTSQAAAVRFRETERGVAVPDGH